jgi:uncharacterized integral membrane protein
MNRRYDVLGLIARLYQIAGIIIVGLALLFLILGLISAARVSNVYGYGSTMTLPTAISVFLASIGIAIAGAGTYAFGELINLFRDLELNTRKTAYLEEKSHTF